MRLHKYTLRVRLLRLVTKALVPKYASQQRPKKEVAVVVPAPGQPDLSEDQEYSLAALRRHLSDYDTFLIIPEGSGRELPGMRSIGFPHKYFGSVAAHNRMLFTPHFYMRFRDYRYILLYHLDALALRDELKEWCMKGFDYIGAPWFPNEELPWVKEPHVGNGGFTLMNVEACIRVLRRRYQEDPVAFWEQHLFEPVKRSARCFANKLKQGRAGLLAGSLETIAAYFDRFTLNDGNNDRFWSLEATKLDPSFRIPDWKTGLRFAFEADPQNCFELLGRKLPFGCHAWQRFDREFWLKHTT